MFAVYQATCQLTGAGGRRPGSRPTSVGFPARPRRRSQYDHGGFPLTGLTWPRPRSCRKLPDPRSTSATGQPAHGEKSRRLPRYEDHEPYVTRPTRRIEPHCLEHL